MRTVEQIIGELKKAREATRAASTAEQKLENELETLLRAAGEALKEHLASKN